MPDPRARVSTCTGTNFAAVGGNIAKLGICIQDRIRKISPEKDLVPVHSPRSDAVDADPTDHANHTFVTEKVWFPGPSETRPQSYHSNHFCRFTLALLIFAMRTGGAGDDPS